MHYLIIFKLLFEEAIVIFGISILEFLEIWPKNKQPWYGLYGYRLQF